MLLGSEEVKHFLNCFGVYISTYNGITLKFIAKLVKVVQIRQKMFLREKKLDSTFIEPGSSLYIKPYTLSFGGFAPLFVFSS